MSTKQIDLMFALVNFGLSGIMAIFFWGFAPIPNFLLGLYFLYAWLKS